MSANWNDSVALTISTVSTGGGEAPRYPVILADVPLDGAATFAVYASAQDVADAATAGHIDPTLKVRLDLARTQSPRVPAIAVAKWDVGGGETPADALTAAREAGLNFEIVTLESRTGADLISAASWSAANDALAILQLSDADALTAGLPAAIAAITTTAAAVVYHPTDTVAADLAWVADRASFNPETISPPWACDLANVATYQITTAQRDALTANNMNAILSYGDGDRYMGKGVLLDGRPIYVRLTELWLRRAVKTEIANAHRAANKTGEGIRVTAKGQAKIVAKLEAFGRRGVSAQHFGPDAEGVYPDGYTVTAHPITTTDRANKTIRVSADYYVAIAAEAFSLPLAIIV